MFLTILDNFEKAERYREKLAGSMTGFILLFVLLVR